MTNSKRPGITYCTQFRMRVINVFFHVLLSTRNKVNVEVEGEKVRSLDIFTNLNHKASIRSICLEFSPTRRKEEIFPKENRMINIKRPVVTYCS